MSSVSILRADCGCTHTRHPYFKIVEVYQLPGRFINKLFHQSLKTSFTVSDVFLNFHSIKVTKLPLVLLSWY